MTRPNPVWLVSIFPFFAAVTRQETECRQRRAADVLDDVAFHLPVRHEAVDLMAGHRNGRGARRRLGFRVGGRAEGRQGDPEVDPVDIHVHVAEGRPVEQGRPADDRDDGDDRDERQAATGHGGRVDGLAASVKDPPSSRQSRTVQVP